MKRRTWLAGAAALAATAARAQPRQRPLRLGWLRPSGPLRGDLQATGIPAALSQIGWVEGRNLEIVLRSAEGQIDRLPALADELVRLRCDVILAVGSAAVDAARRATSTTPIVLFGNFDPVARGQVVSLARPGGNITGVLISPEGTLASKRLELLKDAVPRATRIALLAPEDPNFEQQIAEARRAAESLGLEMPVARVRGVDFGAAFAAVAAERAHALLVGGHTNFVTDRRAIIDLTLQRRLPSSWEWPEQVRDGGLMSYGTRLTLMYQRLAHYVERLSRGEPAAEMPIELPSRFDLVINQRTARAIGLTVPQSLLLRADEVIT